LSGDALVIGVPRHLPCVACAHGHEPAATWPEDTHAGGASDRQGPVTPAWNAGAARAAPLPGPGRPPLPAGAGALGIPRARMDMARASRRLHPVEGGPWPLRDPEPMRILPGRLLCPDPPNAVTPWPASRAWPGSVAAGLPEVAAHPAAARPASVAKTPTTCRN